MFKRLTLKKQRTERPTLVIEDLSLSWYRILKRVPYRHFLQDPWWSRLQQHLFLYYKVFWEQRTYTGDKNYLVYSHNLKKDLLEQFAIPAEQIEVRRPWPSQIPVQEVPKLTVTAPLMATQQTARQHHLIFALSPDLKNGLYAIFSALAELKRNHIENLQLHLPQSQRRKHILRVARELGIADQIHFFTSETEKEKLMAEVDLILLPALYHPQAQALLDCLQKSPAPILLSTAMGGSEELSPLAQSYLVNPLASSQVWLESIWRLLHDQELRITLALEQRRVLQTDVSTTSPDLSPVKMPSGLEQKPNFSAN